MSRIWIAAAVLLATGCRVGPNYKRPPAPVPPAFKEQPPAGWKQSQPGDALLKGKWWELFGDPALNALEEQVAISNQNVLQAEAQYRQAHAAVQVARSALFPVAGVSASATVSGSGASRSSSSSSSTVAAGGSSRGNFTVPFDVSWAPDLWGSVRRDIAGASATAQSLAADLENARLLYQAELAEDYFNLHGVDSEAGLLTRTAASYTEYLKLTRDRFAAGLDTDLDIAQAETQLYGVQAQLIDLGVQRAQLEHAIAILIGKAPAEVTIPAAIVATVPPVVPEGVPSELLERRPDIASAERRVAAANEQIGIAMAAFYPSLTLTGSGGFANSSITRLFSWPSRFWSVGSQLAETLFDAGRRRGVVAEQQAAYDATVDFYRQTVLTALQEVEDNLAALRILADEAAKVDQTVQAANRALDLSTAQYRAGTVSYLTVITSQAALLSAQRSVVTLLSRRLTATVLLIQALGGKWNAPTP